MSNKLIPMALKPDDIRNMKEDALGKKLIELEMELVTGQAHGTKINSIKLSIARIRTHLAGMKKESLNTGK